MIKITAQTLSSINTFETLEKECLEDIAQLCVPKLYRPPDVIIHQLESSSTVYFILSGLVQATMFTQSGYRISDQNLGPGDMFGELAAIEQMPSSTHVVTLKDTQLAAISSQSFLGLMFTYPQIAQVTMKKMADAIRLLCDNVYQSGSLSVSSRVRAELVRLATDNRIEESQATIENMPSSQELADRLATSAMTIEYELEYLERSGLIKQNGQSVTVFNITELSSTI